MSFTERTGMNLADAMDQIQAANTLGLETLTVGRAIELLEAEVKAEGDSYIYEARQLVPGTQVASACDYVRDGKPSCLVGRALHAYGLPVKALSAIEGQGIAAVQGFDFLTGPVKTVLGAAQEAQDSGETWGHSLNQAREAAAMVAAEDSPSS